MLPYSNSGLFRMASVPGNEILELYRWLCFRVRNIGTDILASLKP